MTSADSQIDRLLAAALRGDDAGWPSDIDAGRTAQRIAYHGIAGLLNERRSRLHDWPAAVLTGLRDQSIALAMWELRHQVVLTGLLAALADAKVAALLLKGSALAYDLYPVPATRGRGDSDLLIAPADLATARTILAARGYRRQPLDEGIADDLALQEVWSLTCDAGTAHHIDLHWQLINAPALAGLLDFGLCESDPLPLRRLSPIAWSMNRPLTLLHACVHRAMHLTSPYFVDGVTYYGGDRLVWASDIHLLAAALGDAEWRRFTDAALDQGVAAVCRDGLALARRTFDSAIPNDVMTSLGAAEAEAASAYLLGSSQARRAWLDFKAIGGWRRKLAYLAARGLPSARFLRGKYPALAHRPLALLHLKRMVDLVRPRPTESHRG